MSRFLVGDVVRVGVGGGSPEVVVLATGTSSNGDLNAMLQMGDYRAWYLERDLTFVRRPAYAFAQARQSNVQHQGTAWDRAQLYRGQDQSARAQMAQGAQFHNAAQEQAAHAHAQYGPGRGFDANGRQTFGWTIVDAFVEIGKLAAKHERWARAFFASDSAIIELVEKRAELHRDPIGCDCGGCIEDILERRARWERGLDVAWKMDAFGKRTEYLARTLKALALVNGKRQ